MQLQAALSRVKQLDGLLPICSYCKRIRSDQDYWQQLESYVTQHSEAQFSHGICPACYETVKADFDKWGSRAPPLPVPNRVAQPFRVAFR